MPLGCHYAREHVHTPILYLGNGWTDCAQICCVSRDRYDMWLRQRDWGVSARAQLHTPPLFRVLAWIGWFKVDDCGISRGNFQPTWHVQVTLRHLSCARSFIAHKALYWLNPQELWNEKWRLGATPKKGDFSSALPQGDYAMLITLASV